MSVVAGANLMFGPDMSILLGAAKILSPDGKVCPTQFPLKEATDRHEVTNVGPQSQRIFPR